MSSDKSAANDCARIDVAKVDILLKSLEDSKWANEEAEALRSAQFHFEMFKTSFTQVVGKFAK